MMKDIFTKTMCVLILIVLCNYAHSGERNECVKSNDFKLMDWKVGQRAEYMQKVFCGDKLNDNIRIELSIVGKEIIKQKQYYWVECKRSTQNGLKELFKLLVEKPEDAYIVQLLSGNIDDINVLKCVYQIDDHVYEIEYKSIYTEILKQYAEKYTFHQNLVHKDNTPVTIMNNQVFDSTMYSLSNTPVKISRQNSNVINTKMLNHDFWNVSIIPITGIARDIVIYRSVFSNGGTYSVKVLTELNEYQLTGAQTQITQKPILIKTSDGMKMLKEVLK